MATVKGKTRLCQSTLSDFNIEQVNGSPFYNRYVEFLRVFKKHMKELNPDVVFAQPIENSSKGTIDWYIPESNDTPITLSELRKSDEESYKQYSAICNDVIGKLKNISASIANTQEKEYFDCAIKSLGKDYVEDVSYCHDGYVTFVTWGMSMRKGRSINTVITDDIKEHRVHKVTFIIQGNGTLEGKSSILRKHGHILQVKEIPTVKPANHCNFTEWLPTAPQGKEVIADVTYTAICKRTDDFNVEFVPSEGGSLDGNTILSLKVGQALEESMIPIPVANDGYAFKEWSPNITFGVEPENDLKYTAVFEKTTSDIHVPPVVPPIPNSYHVSFVAGDHGSINGQDTFDVNDGETIPESRIPKVEPKKGYTFTGWDKPIGNPITGNTTYNAVYKKEPWWKRFWLLLWGDGCLTKGCLTWLLRLLLFLLLALLLWWLLRSCVGCSHHAVNGVAPLDTITRSDGKVVDDNGYTHPITGSDGRLPDGDGVVAPVQGEGGTDVPIIRQPGVPNTIANRLFLFMENENDNVEALAEDFKKAYPDDKYSIIGYDKEVKLLVIQIPENERDEIRETINSKIPNHKFLVFDEEIYELNGYISSSTEDKGWHLNAIHLKQGWSYTKGSPKVRVAVVDDGIQADHPMFKDRIADAYNVFTQNNQLSKGEGHGTHTAGLAVGSADYYSQGASGVAPNCTLIPIQVFDNKQCPLSALVAGVMYAIHHEADVVNISIGPSFQGLNVLPVEQQNEIANTQFGNVALLWARVCKIAAQKRCILVFAAGNDDILTSIPPENRNASSIVVTAVDKRLYPTVFTNYGPCSDISAPGKNIYSSFPQSSFQSCDGTSMAAPIVTGTVALMKSLKKDLTVEQARNALYSTGEIVYGWIPPMVLVDKALDATKKGNFKRIERGGRSVPDNVDVHLHSGRIPTDAVDVGFDNNPTPVPNPSTNVDVEEIKRLIKEHEDAIKELKKKLQQK